MHPARSRLAFLTAAIAALAAVLAVVLPAGTASAGTVPAAGTRVWAIPSAAHDHIRAGGLVSAGERLGEPVSCPFYAPGACVAPEAADPTTAALQEHLGAAVERFNSEGLTAAQQRALVDNPGLESAFRGQRIDSFFKESVNNAIESGSDPRLANLYITRSGEFGPDVFDLGNMNRWWDVTTQDSWAAHVAKYGGFPFGTGIPLCTP